MHGRAKTGISRQTDAWVDERADELNNRKTTGSATEERKRGHVELMNRKAFEGEFRIKVRNKNGSKCRK